MCITELQGTKAAFQQNTDLHPPCAITKIAVEHHLLNLSDFIYDQIV